jgi:flagellar protein FliS
METYQQHALEGASAVDLVVALYDGMIRFLYAAVEAVERGDETARRIAVRRVFDIVIHLQARLRMDVGGKPAEALSEFYASIFAQTLEASQSASKDKFEHAIECVRNVREAWREVAKDPDVNPAPLQVGNTPPFRALRGFDSDEYGMETTVGSSWNA